jgi:AraC-like DNA-binding protein
VTSDWYRYWRSPDGRLEAMHAHFQRHAYHRHSHETYGMSPGDYQRQLRLRAARRLIAQGSPIGAAAAQAGFSDQSHLSRWFIRCYGITPGGYQRATALAPQPAA